MLHDPTRRAKSSQHGPTLSTTTTSGSSMFQLTRTLSRSSFLRHGWWCRFPMSSDSQCTTCGISSPTSSSSHSTLLSRISSSFLPRPTTLSRSRLSSVSMCPCCPSRPVVEVEDLKFIRPNHLIFHRLWLSRISRMELLPTICILPMIPMGRKPSCRNLLSNIGLQVIPMILILLPMQIKRMNI